MSTRCTRWVVPVAVAVLALGAGVDVAAEVTAPYQVIEISPDLASEEAKLPVAGEKVPEYREPPGQALVAPKGMAFFAETETNDTAATANALPGSEAVVYGTILPAADVDYFSFTANAGDRVSAATMTSFSNGGSTDTIVTIYASDGTTVLESDDDSGSFSGTSSAISGTVIPAAGTYYILVDGFSTTSTINPYHLHFRVLTGTPTAEVEPNNDTLTATPIAASGWMSGTITATTDPDFFSLTLNAGDSVFIALDMDPDRDPANTNWNGRVGLGLFGDAANQILVVNDGSTIKPHAEAFFITVKSAGTYYPYIDSTSATGLGANARYHLSVRVIPKRVQTDCTVIASTDVPVTIGPAAGTVTSIITVPPTVTSSINDVKVVLDLTHAIMADLDVTLTSPVAATVPLFTDVGSAAAGGQVLMDLVLDENAATPIGLFTVVKGMINEPEQPGRLANFNGQAAGGTWTLSLADDTTNASGGTLNGWSLEICGPPPPAYALELTKTVGFVPGVCATTSSITAPPGASVYYCYTVLNTGLNDLVTHDLVDDQLGTLLNDFPYVLPPGASVSQLSAPVVVNATVTNTANWTGYGAGGNPASDTASATVNVPTQCPAGFQDVTLAFSDFAGTFPPAGWAVANTSLNCIPPGVPEWTNTNPGLRANFTGGVGPFAIADSDRCGSGSTLDTTLTTPILDLTGLTNPRAYFATDYDDIGVGGETAVLEVSTDGGGTWAPVLTWDEDHRGPLAVDQAIPGAGLNNVAVRWHYVNGTYDWWWELDNAMITACEVAAVPAISLAKTVGTTPGVCATTSTISVTAGTTVYYCYEVTNTGDVTLNLHDLSDDVLGTIFTGLAYSLAPGASVNTVAAGLSIPYVVNSTTTNTGTWTAYNAGPIDVVTATASATVDVIAPAPAIALAKTVGTVPGVCAVTDNIAVAAGTEVYYCYQAENTGNVTFELHDLTDDRLGTVLSNLPYTLAPGAFSPEVIVPRTINVDTVNTATWTAKTLPFTSTTFSFIDISATGTALNLTDDGEANIVSPFPFTLFGVTSSDLRVGNNGGILFGVTTGDLSTTNAALPNAAVGRAILPFWDDIDSDTGNVYWEVQGSAPNRVLIVEWYNRPHFSNIGSATFEVLLYEGSNAIKFQYLDTDFGDPLYNAGVSATVGLNNTATNALQYSFNQAIITDGLALLHDPATFLTASSTDTATVDALFPNIDVSPLSLTSTQVTNTVNNVPATIANTGAALLDWQVLETQPDRPANPGVQPAPEPVFNVPAAVTSKADCGAFENYLGREPEGYAEFCGGAVEGPGGGVPEGPTDIGYLINLRTPDRNLKQFVLNNFPGQVVIGPQTANIYGMDFDSTATTLHALNSSTNQLGTLNLTTGVFTSTVACPPPTGASWTDLSIDPVTDVFYASTATNLYTLNPATCSPALVGPYNVPSGIMIDLAVNAAGQMYGHDIFTDSIYTIDTTTGAATLVGLTGYLANFAQGMDFDNQDGTLYIFLYVGSGVNHYGTVNLTTGAVTPLATTNPSGEFEGATQTLGICVPTDYSWLTINPVAGTTPPAGSTPLNAAFDSTGLAVGTYTGQLCVRSNDPDAGPGNGTSLVVVPVTLDVVPPQNPAISLAKTVGTTPGVCAATSSIVVAAGTTVYYCYEVTNTGDVTLNLHDLTDDVLGTIFTGLAYSLAPGASVNTVAAGLSIPYVVNSTTTNTGTWTAYNAGPVNLVTATASATVTVELVPDIEVAPSSLFSSQMTNTQVVQQLTIGNTGGGDLTWTLSEEGLPLHTASFNIPASPAQAPEGTAVAAGGYTARPEGTYTVERRVGRRVPPNVMLLAADDDNGGTSPIQTLLLAYGDLGVVNLYDPRVSTPSLAELQTYDVVVVWSNYVFFDPTAIGNVLADYVDAGGKVIDLNFAIDPAWGYQGRFRTSGYTAMTTSGTSFTTSCLGSYNPAHPIMTGVTDVCDLYRGFGTALTAGSSEVARWQDNDLFVAVKDNGSVATINGYVGIYFQYTGQMPDVLHNAILWIAGAGTGCTNLSDVPWLSASPTAGTTPPAGSTPVDVTFDSTGIAVGTYNANLCAFSNDPDEPIVPVPVTMEVVIPVELMGISIE